MRIGDLVLWVRNGTKSEDIGIVTGVGTADPDMSGIEHFTVHWFADNEVYNYPMGEYDIELIKKV